MDPTSRTPRTPPSPSFLGHLAYGTFFAGAIGGSVLALLFLAVDSMAGRPFFTPSVLGSVAFLGQPATAVTQVNLSAVAIFTPLHFAAFAVLGLLGTLLFQAASRGDNAPTVVTAVVLFVIMQAGMSVASRTILPGVVAVLGNATVLTANALSALAMAVFLKIALGPHTQEEEEHEEDLIEGPALTYVVEGGRDG